MSDTGVARIEMSTIGNKLVDFELGLLDEDEELDLLQNLIDTSLAWRLNGYYGRTCARLIQEGILQAPGEETL